MSGHRLDDETIEGGHVLHVIGALDAETVFEARTKVDALSVDPNDTFVIDLSRTDFMDSSGLGFLAGLARRADAGGWRFRTRGATGQVERLLQRVGWPRHEEP